MQYFVIFALNLCTTKRFVVLNAIKYLIQQIICAACKRCKAETKRIIEIKDELIWIKCIVNSKYDVFEWDFFFFIKWIINRKFANWFNSANILHSSICKWEQNSQCHGEPNKMSSIQRENPISYNVLVLIARILLNNIFFLHGAKIGCKFNLSKA